MPRTGKHIETESKLVVAGDWEEGMGNGCRAWSSFWGWWKCWGVINRQWRIVLQHCEYAKNHWGVQFKLRHHSSVGKESTCNAGDPSSIPGFGRSGGERIGYPLQYSWASLMTQLMKNPPAMRKTWVWKIPWRRERLPTPEFWPGEIHGLYSPWGPKESDTTEHISLSLFKDKDYVILLHIPKTGLDT